ncbi:MAG: phosphate ABC transporter periplasmic substrate-binding protein PstS [Methanoregulaceae archaeon PtaU1.Bin222]|nr:MAG: phosphate ABC transporter periplasmic substrate-binding protein PstS [Methanoregulaceae archaeon PtaU1.Bin222]
MNDRAGTGGVRGTGRTPRDLALAIGTVSCTLLLVLVSGCLVDSAHEPAAGGALNITISGSTTVQPVSEMLAGAFMQAHPGVRISVTGGGSGKGILDTGEGTVSIGAASRMPEPEEMEKYPDLRIYQIGGSGIVVISHREFPGDVIGRDDLARLYDEREENLSVYPRIAGIKTVVQRSDASGTEETFAQWLFGEKAKHLNGALNVSDTSDSGRVEAVAGEGNMAVLNIVRTTPGSIGFVDFGFAESHPDVKMLRIETSLGEVFPAAGVPFGPAIRDELALQNGRNDRYIEGLTRPLLYLTKGAPGPWEESFILFSQSPEAAKYFKEVGYFPLVDFSR